MTARSPFYEWRYTAFGAVAHALLNARELSALCGIGVWRPEDWRGTGSQDEYERVAALPTCRVCLAKIRPRK